MKNQLVRNATLVPGIMILALLSGCGGVNLWPFDGKKAQEASTAPKGATEYQCAGGKKFYVRMIDNGAAAWLILRNREVSLPKAASSDTGARYTNGISTLAINGSEARLDESETSVYADCKAVGKK